MPEFNPIGYGYIVHILQNADESAGSGKNQPVPAQGKNPAGADNYDLPLSYPVAYNGTVRSLGADEFCYGSRHPVVNIYNARSNNIQLIADLVVVLISFTVARIVRFGDKMTVWQSSLYRMVLLFALVIMLFMHFFRVTREKVHVPLYKKDPAAVVMSTVRDYVLEFMLLVVALAMVKEIDRVSRLFLGIWAPIALILGFILRMIVRHFLIRYGKVIPADRHILIVTVSYLARTVIIHLKRSLPEYTDIFGIVLLDADRVGTVIRDVPIVGNEEMIDSLNPDGKFNEVFIYLPYSTPEIIHELIRNFENKGVDVNWSISLYDNDFTGKLIRNFGDYRSAFVSALKEKCRVLGVNFTVSNVDAAVMYVRNHIEELRGKYICFCNVHTSVMSRDDPGYAVIQNSSAFTFADGAPIAKAQRKKGHLNAERVAGPDFMAAMFRASMDGKISHYFYGSTQETIDKLEANLKREYPGIRIKGLYSPPFREMTEEEKAKDIQMINDAGADIVWIGLGAPKQEKWMAEHKDKINAVMVGVGAGFNFHAGTVKRAPVWVQKAGLEWLYRLLQDPRRLVKRYVISNLKYFWYLYVLGDRS